MMSVLAGWESTAARATLPAGRLRPGRLPRHRPVDRPAGLAVAPPARPRVAACAPPYARRRLVALLVLAVATATVVAGLLALRAAATDDGVPQRTTVVEVRGGETLWDVAGRVAPDSSTGAVVERIRELNGMRGSTVHPGQPLLVPDGR